MLEIPSRSIYVNHVEYVQVTPSADAITHDPDWRCIRFVVHPGDRVDYDRQRTRPFERAELISHLAFPFGKPATISFYQNIVPGSAAHAPLIIGQIHNSAEPAERPLHPILEMQINKGIQRIITRAVAERFATAAPQGIIRWAAPVQIGQWTHWVWQLTPSPVMGELKIWRNGAKIFDGRIPLGYNDPRGPYWQFGIYRAKDDTSVGVTYADVHTHRGRPRRGDFPPPPSCPVRPIR